MKSVQARSTPAQSALLTLFFSLALPAGAQGGFPLCCTDDTIIEGDELTARVARELEALTTTVQPSYDKNDMLYFRKIHEFVEKSCKALEETCDRQAFLSELYYGQVTTRKYQTLPLCQTHIIKPNGTLLNEWVVQAVQLLISYNERNGKYMLMSAKQITALGKQGKKC